VSTPAGINGLSELRPGHDVLVESEGAAFADALRSVLTDPHRSAAIGQNARATAVAVYTWDAIAAKQLRLYRSKW
jgi:glycosyltransferase involved in cell wall biosynthesis